MNKYACILLLAGAALGCGSGTSRVEGIVLLDGQPLANSAVQFVPQGTGRDATGQTDASGHFKMSTNEPGDGVVAGEYKVVISPPAGPADTATYASSDEAMAAASKAAPKKASGPPFPQQYTRVDQTPLTQKVPVVGQLKLELKSK